MQLCDFNGAIPDQLMSKWEQKTGSQLSGDLSSSFQQTELKTPFHPHNYIGVKARVKG